jgi:hypothetical protein
MKKLIIRRTQEKKAILMKIMLNFAGGGENGITANLRDW